MHYRTVAVLACFVATPIVAAEVEVTSAIDTVTVYPDGATITRVIRADLASGDTTLIARDFPPALDPSSLRVEGQTSARLVIGSIDARPPRPERPPNNPELEKRLEALKDQRGVLDDEIAAGTARKKFVERFAASVPLGLGEAADARPLAEWRAVFATIAEDIAAADGIIREARLKQRALDREIARLEADLKANPARKMEVRVDLAAEAAASATLRVSYTVRGARWVPLYDARLDSGGRDRKATLELIRRAEIVQQTGEDWTDVALSVSTVRTGRGGSAPELRPLLVRYPAPPPPSQRPAAAGRARDDARSQSSFAPILSDMAASLPIPPMLAEEAQAVVETGGFQALFRVPGRVSIATNEGAKALRIAGASLNPDLMVRAVPALDETAYLQASFKHAEEAPLLPGRVALYRDGIYVGRGQMALTPKDETVHLGFGADDKMKVTRSTVRRNEGSAGIITSSKTDEREFKLTIRNGHEQPIRVQIEDQLPVSEIADVQVEMLPATTPPTQKDIQDRRGVVAWTFDAPPGELREIKLAWRTRWPADKIIVYDPRQP